MRAVRVDRLLEGVAMKARDPREDAPVVGMDLSRSTEDIHRDLRKRYPQYPFLWWELETDEKSGWVYQARTKIVCKIVHVKE